MSLAARILPPLLSLGLLSGCLVELGLLPQDFDAATVDAATEPPRDAGECGAEGASDPSDLCRECRGGVFVSVCERSIVHTRFADFAAGDHSRSPTNLHVAAAGRVHIVTAGDVDGDRIHDVVIGNYLAGDDEPLQRTDRSFLFLGRGARTFVLDETFGAGGVRGAAVADLDSNGSVDLVFTFYENDDLMTWGNARTFWGPELGARSLMALDGEAHVTVADLDGDGYLDLIAASHRLGAAGVYEAPLTLVRGSAAGPRAPEPLAIVGAGATSTQLADFDGDRLLDLLVTNQRTTAEDYSVDSQIYFASARGVFDSAPTPLDTAGASGSCVADLDADGDLDIVVSELTDGSTFKIDSHAFFNDGAGAFTASPLATQGASGCSIADLDQDGQLDVVFSCSFDDLSTHIDSMVYWGDGGDFSTRAPTGLPTIGAAGSQIVDFDGDGWLDILFLNQRTSTGSALASESVIYWGGEDGFEAEPTSLTGSYGAGESVTRDLGNLHDRGAEEVFVSSAIDVESSLGEVRPASRLAWSAQTPGGSTIRLQLRSADTLDALEGAEWSGPAGPGSYYERPLIDALERGGRQFLQYRAVFGTPGFLDLPSLDSVTVYFE